MTDLPVRDYVPPPGTTLAEILREREMSQAQLARQMSRPPKTINEIVKGKAQILPDTALQLETVLGLPASFWLRRESVYREHIARQAENKKLLTARHAFSGVPIKVLERFGWIPQRSAIADKLREVLQFMRVGNPEGLLDVSVAAGAAFRKGAKYRSDPLSIAAWLRRGEQLAEQALPTIRAPNIAGFRDALPAMRANTRRPVVAMIDEMRAACSEFGVVLLVVPHLPKSSVSGATRWLRGHPVIQLSLRFRQAEQLAFSFFHEAGHVILHNHDLFVDEVASDVTSEQEQEADAFARDCLISPDALREFLAGRRRPHDGDILRFAKDNTVAPGIVVGRLQHDGVLKYADHSRHLLRRISDAEADLLNQRTIDWVSTPH